MIWSHTYTQYTYHLPEYTLDCAGRLFIELDRRERIKSTLENWIMLISNTYAPYIYICMFGEKKSEERDRENRARNRVDTLLHGSTLCVRYANAQSGE